MDVTATLAALAAPAADQDAADTRDPAVAAAFTAVLAGMVTTAAPPAAPPSDAGGGSTDRRAAVGPPLTAPTAAAMVAPALAGGSVTEAATAAVPASPSPTAGAPAPTHAPAEQSAPDPGAPPVTDPASARPPAPGSSTPPRPLPLGAERSSAPRVATGPVDEPLEDAGPVDGDEPAARRSVEVPAPVDGIAAAPAERQAATTSSPAVAVTPSGSRMVERAIAAQVVQRVGRLVEDDGEGSHELSLQLEPADLGRLELRVRLEAGVVHVHVEAHARGTSDLLRQALPELRAALTEAGLSPGGLDVHDHGGPAGGGGGARHPDREPAGAARAERSGSRPVAPPVLSPALIGAGATRGVDVLL